MSVAAQQCDNANSIEKLPTNSSPSGRWTVLQSILRNSVQYCAKCQVEAEIGDMIASGSWNRLKLKNSGMMMIIVGIIHTRLVFLYMSGICYNRNCLCSESSLQRFCPP